MDVNTINWDKIKKKRDGYFVEYQPARYEPDDKSYPLAILIVVIVSQFSKDAIAQVLENEFKIWASLYPVALMAMACDEAESKIDLSSVRPGSDIVGFCDPTNKQIALRWELLKDDQIPDLLKRKERLKEIYRDVPFKTGQEIKEKTTQYYQNIRTGRRVIFAALIIWLLVPVAIEIWGISNPFISAAIVIYSIVKAAIALLKLLGILKPSTKEISKSEKERKMEHYYYHCEMNPMGFLRLRNENFEREARESIKKEYEDLS